MSVLNVSNISLNDSDSMDEILNNFNFTIVEAYMNKNNWIWHPGYIPTVLDLKKSAKRLLKDACERKLEISTGGFHAKYENDKNNTILTLAFKDSHIDDDMDDDDIDDEDDDYDYLTYTVIEQYSVIY